MLMSSCSSFLSTTRSSISSSKFLKVISKSLPPTILTFSMSVVSRAISSLATPTLLIRLASSPGEWSGWNFRENCMLASACLSIAFSFALFSFRRITKCWTFLAFLCASLIFSLAMARADFGLASSCSSRFSKLASCWRTSA